MGWLTPDAAPGVLFQVMITLKWSWVGQLKKGGSNQKIILSACVCPNPRTDPPLGIWCPCSCSSLPRKGTGSA